MYYNTTIDNIPQIERGNLNAAVVATTVNMPGSSRIR